MLPVPAEAIGSATLRYREGRLTIEKATAKLGTCTAEVSLETRLPVKPAPIPSPSHGLAPGTLASTVREKSRPVDADQLMDLEENLESIDLTLSDLTLNDELFSRLGEKGQMLKKRFNPIGVVAIGYHFHRPLTGGWTREFELRPTLLRHDLREVPLSADGPRRLDPQESLECRQRRNRHRSHRYCGGPTD